MLAASWAGAFLVAGCSSDQGDTAPPPVAPQGGVPQVSMPDVPQPARTYENACGTCHHNGGFAVQVLADRLGADAALIHRRNNLDPDTIRTIVRSGMGAMPAMSKLEVSDVELDDIIAYLGKARVGEDAR